MVLLREVVPVILEIVVWRIAEEEGLQRVPVSKAHPEVQSINICALEAFCDLLDLLEAGPEDVWRVFMRLPLECPRGAIVAAEAAAHNVVEVHSPLHSILRRRLIEPFPIEASAVEDQLEALDKLLPPVPDHEEQVHQIAVDVVVDLDQARRLVEQHVGCAPKGLHVNAVRRNEWQKRLQQIEFASDERKEAGPSQRRVG